MSEYSQTRSFNVGIAQDTSIEAALIYDDLAYAQKVFGKGYFFRSDEQMLLRFPFMSKSTIRRHVQKLAEGGYISTKVAKVNTKPTLHYQIEIGFGQIEQKGIGNSQNDQNHGNSQNDQNLLTNNYKTTKSDISVGAEQQPSAPRADTPARAFLLEGLIKVVNPKEKVTQERLRMLNARLKDYTADEVMSAANSFSKSEWHKENKQMSIDNLLAPSKFGRWYTASQDAKSDTPAYTEEQRAADKAEALRRRNEVRNLKNVSE